MDPSALRLAAELGGHLLAGPDPAQSLLLVERSAAHGAPTLLVLGLDAADLAVPLEAAAAVQARGTALNLCAVLPLPRTELAAALAAHRRRLGSILGALHAGLPWMGDRPMLPKRLPGRVRAERPLPLPEAELRPLERRELRAFLSDWPDARWERTFLGPAWESVEGGFEAPLWPDVPLPPGAELRVPPLVLPSATPFTDVLRGALRGAGPSPVPWLPVPGDPTDLHALRRITPQIAAFHGPRGAWEQALARLAGLPAPPHFCARC